MLLENLNITCFMRIMVIEFLELLPNTMFLFQFIKENQDHPCPDKSSLTCSLHAKLL